MMGRKASKSPSMGFPISGRNLALSENPVKILSDKEVVALSVFVRLACGRFGDGKTAACSVRLEARAGIGRFSSRLRHKNGRFSELPKINPALLHHHRF